jgi:hypothetical protein
MKTWKQWLKEAGAGVPYIGQDPGGAAGAWQGAPSKGKIRSVGDVKIKKDKKNDKKLG